MAKTSKQSTDEELDAPPGWRKIFSTRKNRFYYYNDTTGLSVWKYPTQEKTTEAKQKSQKKSKQKKKGEKSSSINNQTGGGAAKPGTSKGRLLPKVKKGSDLCKAVKKDPAFQRAGSCQDGNSLQIFSDSGSESGVCKLHKNISCSKQKAPPANVGQKKLTKKRLAGEALDSAEDTEESKKTTPNKRQKCLPGQNTPKKTAAATRIQDTRSEKDDARIDGNVSATQLKQDVPAKELKYNLMKSVVETSGRKLLQRQKRLSSESLKVQGQNAEANSNTNNSSERTSKTPSLLNKAKTRYQAQTTQTTRTTTLPAVSQLPSYEKVSPADWRKSAEPLNTYSSPLSHIHNKTLPQKSYDSTNSINDISKGSSSSIVNKSINSSTTCSKSNNDNPPIDTKIKVKFCIPKLPTRAISTVVQDTKPRNDNEESNNKQATRLPRQSPLVAKSTSSVLPSKQEASSSKFEGSGQEWIRVQSSGQSKSSKSGNGKDVLQSKGVFSHLDECNTSWVGGQGIDRRGQSNSVLHNNSLSTSLEGEYIHVPTSLNVSKNTWTKEQVDARSRRSWPGVSQEGAFKGRSFVGSDDQILKSFSFSDSSQGSNAISAAAGHVEEEMDIELSTVESEEKKPTVLYVVVDTNVLIDEIDFILELKDYSIPDIGQPYIVIPWVVLGELDALKMGKSSNYVIAQDSKNKARTAGNVLNSLLEGKHPRFVGQTAKQNAEKMSWFEVSSNDDRILKCCLQFEKLYGSGSTVLLSNDTNLRSKAVVSGIPSSSKLNFYKFVSKLTTSSKTTANQHSPVSTDKGVDVFPGTSTVTMNSPSLLAPNTPSGISTFVHTTKIVPTTSDHVTGMVPSTSANISGIVPSTSAQSPWIVPSTSAPNTKNIHSTAQSVKKALQRSHTEKDLADEIFLEVKLILKEALSVILRQEMQEVYGELWENIVFCKPPWSLLDVLNSINKHWIAVFGLSLDRSTQENVRSLINYFKSYDNYTHDLKICNTMILSGISLCEGFCSLQKYSERMTDVVKTLIVMRKITIQVSSGKLKVNKLEVLKQAESSQGGDIDMKPETVTVTTATSNSTESTVSIATSATVANDSAVTQCFQTVWESITYFSGQISERLSTNPQDNERVEVLDFLCKLCANLACLHSVYSNIIRDTASADTQGSFAKLLQVLQRFVAELNVQNLNIPLLEHMKLFFTSPANRVTTESGLVQLQQMMEQIASIQGLLTRDEVVAIEMYSQRHSVEMGVT